MKAPQLGFNNGRYRVKPVQHGIACRDAPVARGAVIMADGAARHVDSKAPYRPAQKVGLVEFTKLVKVPRRNKGWVEIEVKAWVINKSVEPEPERHLCAIPQREKPPRDLKVRRNSPWPVRYGNGDNPASPAMMVKGSVGITQVRVERKVSQSIGPERHKVRAAYASWQGGTQ